LRGISLPDPGTPQDYYLQLLMHKENERFHTTVQTLVSALWSTVPSEGQKTFVERTSEMLSQLFKLVFPFVKDAPKAQNQQSRDQKDLAMLKQLMQQMGPASSPRKDP
jgi:polyhydroxyalkanoate synthesis regulator protein